MAIWKVLRGIHSDKNTRLVKSRPVEKGETEVERVSGVFLPGDIIETKVDLRQHNRGSQKFELLPYFDTSSLPKRKQESDDELEKMTIPALRKMAQAEEIELGDAQNKTEIINVIRLSQGQPVEA